MFNGKIKTLNDMIEAQRKIYQNLEDTLNNWIHVIPNDFNTKEVENDMKGYEVVENEAFNQRKIYDFLIELQETRKESRTNADEAYKRGLQDGKEAAILAKPVYIYKTVRSYTDNCTSANKELIKVLDNGFEFVRASEVVKNGSGNCDFIEYILRKEIN